MPSGTTFIDGDWLVAEVDGCTCFGGDAHHGHQPGCGLEPCGQWPLEVNQQMVVGGKIVDNYVENDPVVSLSCLWDMSDIGSPLPLHSPPKSPNPRVWFGGVEIQGVKSIELDISYPADDAF